MMLKLGNPSYYGVVVYAIGALLVSLPVISAILLAVGKGYGAKALFGAWLGLLGLLVPALVVSWFVGWS